MTQLRKRHVFYLSGFDPRGAGHYHKLYKSEAAKQARINGLALEISRRTRTSPHSHQWQINANQTTTDYEFLEWDDIIRAHWATGPLAVMADFLLFIRAFVISRLVFRIVRISPNLKIAAFYPVTYITATLLLAAAAIIAGFSAGIFGAIAGAVLAAVLILFSLRLGNKLAVFWLLRLYVFATRWANGQVAGIDERIKFFAARVNEAIADPQNDEVLLVSHSVGTMLAISVLAQLENVDEKFSFITLGHCIPLLSLQKNAASFRDDLQKVGQKTKLIWLDYSAKSDGICFAQVDPVAVTGAGKGPVLLSPRFFKLYTPEHYKKLKRDWYTMHFLYIMSTDLPCEYDYFMMTSGPQALKSKS